MRKIYFLIVVWCGVFSVETAHAHVWMVRHGYNTCSTCHADPSGSGLLTEYGRAQGEVLLRMPFGRRSDDEPGNIKNFLWFAKNPEHVLLGGSFRGAYLNSHSKLGTDSRFILMQADLAGEVRADRFRAHGMLGFAYENAFAASLTSRTDANLVSRQHWVGVELGENHEFLVRLGRINLPYGIRSNEHTMWIRSETRTDINTAQQHGVSIAYANETLRTEIMAIAGNFQLRPDAYRERGMSAYLEYSVEETLSLGASALVTHIEKDLRFNQELFRQAYGMFARYVPVKPLVVMAEVDVLGETGGKIGEVGYASLLQGDYEPVQGLHFIGALESAYHGTDVRPAFGIWGGVNWFFAPHADLRFDTVYRLTNTSNSLSTLTFLFQLHTYL